MKRILAVLLYATAAAWAIPGVAQAQEAFPNKIVKIVLPFAAGGSTDILARSLAERLGEVWKQPVIVENRPGASGTIATSLVAKSPADGYTLLIATAQTHAVAPGLYSKLQYDPVRDFTSISELVAIPQVLVVNPQQPMKSLKEMVEYAKANPGLFTHGGGTGSAAHMAMELLSSRAGFKTLHIPYRGSGPAMIDVLGGQLSGGFDVISTALPHIQTGKVRPLAVTTPQRSPLLPNVPTVAESGYPGFEASVWFGLFAPAKLPANIVAKIGEDTRRVLQEAKLKEKLEAAGFNIVASTPAAFAVRIKDENVKWRQVIKDNNIKIE